MSIDYPRLTIAQMNAIIRQVEKTPYRVCAEIHERGFDPEGRNRMHKRYADYLYHVAEIALQQCKEYHERHPR